MNKIVFWVVFLMSNLLVSCQFDEYSYCDMPYIIHDSDNNLKVDKINGEDDLVNLDREKARKCYTGKTVRSPQPAKTALLKLKEKAIGHSWKTIEGSYAGINYVLTTTTWQNWEVTYQIYKITWKKCQCRVWYLPRRWEDEWVEYRIEKVEEYKEERGIVGIKTETITEKRVEMVIRKVFKPRNR